MGGRERDPTVSRYVLNVLKRRNRSKYRSEVAFYWREQLSRSFLHLRIFKSIK
eukprot:gene9187-6464_t